MDEKMSTFKVVETYHGYAIAKGPIGTFGLAVFAPRIENKTGMLAFTYGNARECKEFIDHRRSRIN